MTKKIGFIVGSLKETSFNRMFAKHMIGQLPEGYEGSIINIADLQMYKEDYDVNVPAEYTSFREEIDKCDGIVFFTPEYNRSFSGAVKNALDVGSRPYGKSKWAGKPAAVFSVSMGPFGGLEANNDLKKVVSFLGMPVLPAPEVCIASAFNFIKDGEIVKDTSDFLQSATDSYVAFLDKNLK